MAKTITSANAQFALAIAGLYPAPQILQGYAAEDAFSTGDISNAQTVRGVDGKMSAGFVFADLSQTITVMPDSPSLLVFNNWTVAQLAAREVLIASATIILPSISMKYVLTKGVLTMGKPIPDVKRVLQAVGYQITWESIVGAQI